MVFGQFAWSHTRDYSQAATGVRAGFVALMRDTGPQRQPFALFEVEIVGQQLVNRVCRLADPSEPWCCVLAKM